MNTVIITLITDAQVCEFNIARSSPADPTPPLFSLVDPPIVPMRGYSEPGGALAPPSPDIRAIQFISRPGGYGFGEFRISAGYLYLKSDGDRTNFQCAIQSPADAMSLEFSSSSNVNAAYYWLWTPTGDPGGLTLLQNSTINPGQIIVVPVTTVGATILRERSKKS